MSMPLHPLLHRLSDARVRTDAVFDMISLEALYKRPIPERHRMIFYLGHLESFDWNLLGARTFGLESENPVFDKLFAFGIDPVGGNLPSDVPGDWPSEREVRAYNARVRQRIDERIAKELSASEPRPEIADGTLLNVAIEHRLMHAETLAYLIHQLPFEDKKRERPAATLASGAPCESRTVAIPAGVATLGMPRRDASAEEGSPSGQPRRSGDANDSTPAFVPAFGWDNEFESATERVPEFAISACPVTNGEFLEFVRAGGYRDKGVWAAADWDWIAAENISRPHLWIPAGDAWNYRGMFEESPLPLNCPVYVSHAEASAYARWAGKSLPTEAQWHRAAYGTPEGKELSYPWGDEAPDRWRGNFDFASWDTTPVTTHPAGASRFGVYDLLGNGWEWTSTPFAPLPGFQPFPFYPGYSADFFDGKHFVMKGGSQRTAACMLRRTFRNWFQPHYPYVYAKFRCVEG
jgi:formylglycine-generating enzyme required for sulfatase activity